MAINQTVSDRIVWPPYLSPSHPDKPQVCPSHEHIHIKHHRYDTTLFTLPPLDAGGFHHKTARTACGILDGNRWDGFFSLDKQDEQPVAASEKILRVKSTITRHPGHLKVSIAALVTRINLMEIDPNYAVTPTFENWRFPHGEPPSFLPQYRILQATTALLSRPESY
jgi:hypothetical protein